MAERPYILQVSTSDISGGAQRVAWNLFRCYRDRGHGSWLAVGHKLSSDPDILPISHRRGQRGWRRFGWAVYAIVQQLDGNGRLSRWVHLLAEPGALYDYLHGIEDFHYPGTRHLLGLTPWPPDIVHCHNLHGGYFDLRALSWLSHRLPVILTLHDAWLLSGHCAHSFDCERWKIGCGQCPDLTIYPAIRRDATAYNWQRKREVFAQGRFYVATPSRWLMDKVGQSMLARAIVEARVIPNGVDLNVFRPADRGAIRATMGITEDTKMLLFTASGIRWNVWKDYLTMRAAVGRVAERIHGKRLLFVALGEDGSGEQIDRAEIRFVPYQQSPEAVARYYQAADVYIHAAKAETFPNTILEALACGTPVVATAVGGIPEQVKGLGSKDGYRLEEATGFLTSPGNAEELANRIVQLLEDEVLRQQMARNATRDAQNRFDLERQAGDYVLWYEKITSRPYQLVLSSHESEAIKAVESHE